MNVGSIAVCVLGLFSVAGGPLANAQAPRFSTDVHRLVPYPQVADSAASVGDIDGDGDSDLVQDRRVLFNDGTLLFSERGNSLPAAALSAVTSELVDLDGDGDVDLARQHGGGFEWWANDGSGAFGSASVQFIADWEGLDFAMPDVDGDLDRDLVIAFGDMYYGSCIAPQLWLNDGSGYFTDASANLHLQNWPYCKEVGAVAHGDVDSDGDEDLYFRGWWHPYDGDEYYPDYLMLNDGAGSFTVAFGQFPICHSGAPPTFVDIDGDLDLDLLFGGHRLHLNDGTGFFSDQSAALPTIRGCMRHAVADIDGDGDSDVVLDSYCLLATPPSVVWVNDGTGTLTELMDALPVTYGPLTPIDVDSDGDIDLITDTGLYLNDGGTSFVDLALAAPVFEGVFDEFAAGDIDGDHDLDLVFGGYGPEHMFAGDGAGHWRDVTSDLEPFAASDGELELIDLDGDGDLDLIACSDANDRVRVNDGTGTFTAAPWLWPTAPQICDLDVGDVDGDGDADVLTPRNLFFNDGAGYLAESPGAWPAVPQNFALFELVDVDSDGDLDALCGGYDVGLLLNDGAGRFQIQPGALSAVAGTIVAALGDFDGDGDVDLACIQNVYGSPLKLFANDGAGNYSAWPAALPQPHAYLNELNAADIDADADLDIVFSFTLDTLVNDGFGGFSVGAPLVPGFYSTWHKTHLRDIDLDGDTDVLVSGINREALVLTNLTRQLAWRTPPRIGAAMELELHGPADAEFLLLATHAPAFVPFGALGVLRVNRNSLELRRQGRLDANGRAVESYAIANDPALAGTSLYWQALIANPRRLTNLEVTTFLLL